MRSAVPVMATSTEAWSSTKRRAYLVVLAVVFGAISNLISASTLAYGTNLRPGSDRWHGWHSDPFGHLASERRGFGVKVRHYCTTNMPRNVLLQFIALYVDSDQPPVESAPDWIEPDGTHSSWSPVTVELAAGWPLPTSRYQVVDFSTGVSRPTVNGGCRVGGDSLILATLFGSPARIIPVTPIWSGMVVNTAVHATIMLIVIAAWNRGRSACRRARDRCTQCAYPLGSSSRCTECGRSRNSGATVMPESAEA